MDKRTSAALIIERAASEIQAFLPNYHLRLIINEKDIPAGIRHFGLITSIVEEIAGGEGLSAAQLCGPKGSWHLCDLRQMIWLILHTDAGVSLVEIGRFFNRHHATIISGIRHISGIVDTEAKAADKLIYFRNLVQPIIHFYKNYYYDNY